MHPILTHPARLAGYFAVAVLCGLLLASLVEAVAPGEFAGALWLALPLALFYAFQCLAVWYPVRALAEGGPTWSRKLVGLAVAALASAALWTAIGRLWSAFVEGPVGIAGAVARYRVAMPIVFALGIFLFVLAALLHGLFAAAERSRAAEKVALELRVMARDAELRALKAQLDPHFLFNSLNSVSALIGSDPKAARRMCLLLAGFFRKSLGLGSREAISFGEELFLAETYLSIEEVRFGARLRFSSEVSEETRTLAVPPLVLQPLVENAVHHGIAHLIDGGEVRLAARRTGGFLELAIENPCDPDRPASRGAGVGLANVRDRLAALYGGQGRLEVESLPDRFRVRLLLPATPATGNT